MHEPRTSLYWTTDNDGPNFPEAYFSSGTLEGEDAEEEFKIVNHAPEDQAKDYVIYFRRLGTQTWHAVPMRYTDIDVAKRMAAILLEVAEDNADQWIE